MLEKTRRITKEHEFKEVFKKGAFIKGGFISLKIGKRRDKNTKFGFIVGQKISKSAVVRNKIKRHLRAVVEGIIGKIRLGRDVVIMPSTEIVGKSFNEIKKEMETVFKKARLL